jgi:predicted ester cyclase
MSTTAQLEANKQLVRDFTAQVFSAHQPHLAAKFMTPDVVWHGGALGTITGVDGLIGLLNSLLGSLPDLYAAEQDILADGDLVSVRYVVTATVRDALLGVPANGTQLRWDAVDIYRVTDGKIVEEWAQDDIASIMAQVGAFNPPWAG